ncbi:50S ribosomal protein L32 [Desulfurispira natronophila]|uniref:Large ribosomal subunit protein bL32 n=1 Tax=Desulfurispira natronophila TaxID=682562 RepID=A0A7W7Y4N8_9BACT|nr:50S ribosomal protein L32 [Desulfurispira natronophila]MBB5022026.1 large subunit ribosomal protein L32 [Desulfurispira natronophila]
MALPKKKISRARRGTRRAHQALSPVATVSCPNCNEPKRPHRLCLSCGHYGEKQVIEVDY